MKIVAILEVRPQFIKIGAVSRDIMQYNQSLVDGFSFLEKVNQILIFMVIVLLVETL